MNNFFWIVIAATCLAACGQDNAGDGAKVLGPNASMVQNPATANAPLDSNQLARIQFEHKEFDFGTVEEGAMVKHAFKFTNTGKVPLLITNARSSCGCTVPDWPKDPIPPGGTGEIAASFNTEGRPGNQRKLIYIDANTYPSDVKVLLKGEVLKGE